MATLQVASVATAYELVATPARWPELALFSSRVAVADMSMQRTAQSRLTAGTVVDELAGAPPLLPLQLSWVCKTADVQGSRGEVFLDAGTCQRSYKVAVDARGGCRVELTTMCMQPSPLYRVLLTIDAVFFPYLLSAAAASDGSQPSVAKPAIVWSVLISGWALSSFGWMAAMPDVRVLSSA